MGCYKLENIDFYKGYALEKTHLHLEKPLEKNADPFKKFLKAYRYGFNGMEGDPEVSGEGNSYTTEFRQYDPRLGRWKSLDPLMSKYPDQSPYAGFNNNPIWFKDPTGLEGEPPKETGGENEGDVATGDDGTCYAYQCGTEENNYEDEGWVEGKQYLKDKYGVEPYDWFGSDFENQFPKIVDAFERQGTETAPPSALFTFAMGEGLVLWTLSPQSYDFDSPVNSFDYFGLDFFGSEFKRLKAGGYVPEHFNEGDEFTMDSPFTRYEAGGPTTVYPVTFKNVYTAVEGFSIFYKRTINNTIDYGTQLGYGQPTMDQVVFWSYSRFGMKLGNFGLTGGWDFMSYTGYDKTTYNPPGTMSKAYRRYVTWKYVEMLGIFSE